jgi:hypothetical protein
LLPFLALLFFGQVVSDYTPCRRPDNAVMPCYMSRHGTDHGALDATSCLSSMGPAQHQQTRQRQGHE